MDLTIEKIEKLSELYKIFGDSTRLKILFSLVEKEKNVNMISNELNISQSAISHQLKNLKISKLVKCKRDGQNIYYSLDDIHIYKIIDQGLKHIEEKD